MVIPMWEIDKNRVENGNSDVEIDIFDLEID